MIKKNHEVTAIKSNTGTIEKFTYTKLILAQGGRPIKPTLPGSDLPHVFSLWTLADMDRINLYIKEHQVQTAVVVGGGFIGLEMVEALVKRGLHVHVIEMMPHVMNVMEAEIAGFIETEMRSKGVEIHKQISVTEITSGNVILQDGSFLKGRNGPSIHRSFSNTATGKRFWT